jgi:hypothetical protein
LRRSSASRASASAQPREAQLEGLERPGPASGAWLAIRRIAGIPVLGALIALFLLRHWDRGLLEWHPGPRSA